MKISEHANYLLNEYGRLQFDYAAFCKPYGESLRNEARNNLEEYIAELEAENRNLMRNLFLIDDTEKIATLNTRNAELEAECEQLRRGIHDETVPEKYEENVAKLQKEFSMRFENESPVEFYRTIRSGQYPQPPEVQE